jgi:branched-chain amino acid transport system substrate-binding protein
MQVKRFNVCVVIAVSLMLIFSTGALAATTFKLGVMGPFTGPAAKVGTEFKGSVKMAMENIDYKIGDYKIEIVWIDSQSDPAKATSAYAEAVESKGVQVAMLNWHSSVAAAVMDIAAQYKVQHFFAMGAAAIVNEKYKTDPEKYS